MFVDGPEFFLILAQLDTEGNILTKFKNSPTSGLGDAIIRNVYRRTVGRTDGQDCKKLRPEELIISKKGRQI